MACGCDDKCELPKALQINNPGEVTLFHRVEIPASQGDDETYPPKNGLYRNVLLVYLANNHAYLYSSDGIPTRVDGDSAAGVPKGGLTGQVLMKKTNEDYDTKWETQTSANDAKLTLTRNNTEIGDFTANASVDKTIDIEVPTKTSDLENDGATGESTYAEATDINAIWEEIEEIEAASDVTDVVGTYAELEAYDTSKLKDNDIIKVLEDETQNDQITYYRWDTDTETFTLIGAIGPYYTKSEADTTFQGKLTAGSNITIDANNEISATDTTYTAGEGININGTTIAAKVRRLYDFYTSRPASANLTATGNGGMFTFQATSSMTTGKPKNDGPILHLEWDNANGYDTQLAVSNNANSKWVGFRQQSAGTWGNWIYLLNDEAGSVKTTNIDALAVTTAKIADGAVTATKLASGVLAYSTFEGLSGGTSGYWKRLGNVTFAQHQQGKSVLLKILLGLGNNSNDHQQAFIDLVGQLAWTGANNGRAGWTAEFNRMNNESSTSIFDIKVIANSITSYDVYIRAAGTYMSVTPIFIPGLHSDGTENAIWTPDYNAWTATAPSGTECAIAKVSVAMQSELPTVNNATLTIQKNGTTVETFTANSSTNKTANITVPTKTSDLTNDGSDNTSTYVEADELRPSYIEGEGTEITLQNTQGSRFSDIKLKGDTAQSGSNVLTLVQTDNSKGLTVTQNSSSNSITYSGTTNSGYPWVNGATNVDMPMDAGTFIISIDKTLPYALAFRFYNSSGQYPTTAEIAAGSMTATVTVSYAIKKVIAMLGVDSGVTISSTTIKLTMSSTAPTPSYPQTVQTATGEQTITITSKNLLEITPSNHIVRGTYVSGANTDQLKITATGSDLYLNEVKAAGSTWDPANQGNIIPAELGETFYFNSGNTSFTKNLVTEYDENKISLGYYGLSAASGSFTTRFNGCKYISLRLGYEPATVGTTYTLAPMVSRASITEYEPYTNQEFKFNLGKNLFDKDNVNTINGYLSSNGTIVTSSPDRVWWIPCQSNTTYTVQRMDNATLNENRFQLATTSVVPVAGGTISGRVGLTNGTAGTVLSITTGANAKYLCMQLYHTGGSTTESAMLATVQVEKGSTATSYASYFTPVELCKIGDYQDYIYKNNGTWYLHKETAKIVDNGASGWSTSGAAVASGVSAYVHTGLNIPDYTPGYVNMATLKTSWSDWTTGDGLQSGAAVFSSNNYYFKISTSIASTVAQLQSFLASTPLITYYPLATAIDTPITGTLLDDLNALDNATTYKGYTYLHVGSVSPDLPAILNATTEKKSILPTATKTNVGVVSVGDGLKVTDGGVLSLVDNVVYSEGPGTPIGDVVDPYTYSTTETRIGTWIDGKPLYRRVFSADTTVGGTLSVPVGTNDIATVVKADVSRTIVSTTTDTVGSYYVSSSDYFRYWVRKTQGGVYQVELRSASSSYGYIIIIEYTKTTD